MVREAPLYLRPPRELGLVLAAPRPPPAGLIQSSRRVILFGGCGSLGPGKGGGTYNDTWLLQLPDRDNDALEWKQLETRGEAPPARWRHTANVIEDKTLVVFGGLSGGKRFADVYTLDLETSVWTRIECKGAVPPPRAHHSATLVGRMLYVFGGYGGQGVFHGELYVLEIDTWTWVKPATKGTAPCARSDHMAAFANGRIAFYGGQDGKNAYCDMHLLEIESLTWTRVGGEELPSWGAQPLSSGSIETVESVPDWKAFVFGGRTDFMKFTNAVSLVDMGSMSFSPVSCSGTAPSSREDSAMIYDAKSSRMLLFGGWNNKWLADTHYLSVAEIVGPPYAVLGLEPQIGPVTGRTTVTLKGIRFFEAAKIDVRFSWNGQEVLVPGKFISDTAIQAVTPSFERFGPQVADVRVSIGGKTFNLQATSFFYFDETRANTSLAFGPAILDASPAGIPVPVRLQAKDFKGMNRLSGADPFKIGATENLKGTPADSFLTDNGDGTYVGWLIFPYPGDYAVQVTLDGKPIRGAPFPIKVTDPWGRDRTSGSAPLMRPRVDIALVQPPSAPRSLIVFGGEDSYDVHLLNVDTLAWSGPRINGNQFSPRVGHSVCVVGETRVVVMGGHAVGEAAEGQLFFEDIHLICPDKGGEAWSWHLCGATGPGHAPSPRFGHATAALPGGKRMLVFGGLTSVSNTPRQGPPPPKHTADKITGILLSDIHIGTIDDAAKIQWTVPARVGGKIPAPRLNACAAPIGHFLYVFGGHDGAALRNDLCVCNMENEQDFEWEAVEPKGVVPPPRERATLEVVEGELWLHGGLSAGGEHLSDLHVYNVESQTWRRVYREVGSRLSVLVGKRLVALSHTETSSAWNVVESVEPLALAEHVEFQRLMSITTHKVARELDEFVTGLDKNLGLQVQEGNLSVLLKVMSAVNDIRSRADATDLRFDTLRETMEFLKKTGVDMSGIDTKVSEKRALWNAVKAKFPGVAEVARPFREREGQKIQQDLASFTEKVAAFRAEFAESAFFRFAIGTTEAYAALDATLSALRKLERQRGDLAKYADTFDFGELIAAPSRQLEECREELVMCKELWDAASMVLGQVEEWKGTLWNDINTEFMDEETKKFVKEIRALDKRARGYDAYSGLETVVKNFLTVLPMISDLRHPSMRDRHWSQLMEETHVHFEMTEDFKLADLLSLELHNHVEAVGDIVDRAQKEEKMEKSIEKLRDFWAEIVFHFAPHKQSDVHQVKLAEDDFETLEEHQVMVQNMMASKYVAVFQEEVTRWQKSLAAVAEVGQILQEIQRTWSYLEDLFIGSDEVRRELPEDSVRFVAVDKEVRAVLRDVQGSPKVIEFCNRDGLLASLGTVQKELEVCEKALADYLEAKRTAFPRFYFISRPDLLDILSNGNRPAEVMQHLPKIFQAIKKLELTDDKVDGNDVKVATSMFSPEGEQVKLDKAYALDGKVETWLHRVILAMRSSLKTLLYKAVTSYNEKPREQWVFDHPAQLVLVSSQIWWANEVVAAFQELAKGKKDALRAYNEFQIEQLKRAIQLVLGKLERNDRQKIMCLITLDTHARDVIANMVRDGVSSEQAFGWQSQLRIRWDEQEKDCFINICDAEFRYGYEYLGNGPRLVITPLTDRIYITATQSLHLVLGCAPAGPAGTGKTETTKDLGSQLGKAVYVFNCSDQMDYRTMGDIFKGLASSGAWGCFDEFNRLPAEVLSVCSVQFKSILDGIKEKRDTFQFLGAPTNLDPTCGVFITMNPGYLGRTELPESIKTLFRPVTVMVPDLELICENMLMAEGYQEAKILARKFVTLYGLCRDLLSKQDHYDWGLRAIKSVLVVAGGFKRAEPAVSEHALLMRALRDFNLPKIYKDDLVVFAGLIEDLFPGITIHRKRNMEFEEIIRGVCVESGLQPDEDFILKVVQLEELLAIRHCVFTIGPSGTGKTQVYKMLAKAWGKMGKKTHYKDLNPKAITSNELYGYVQLATREWQDGLLSSVMREFANSSDPNPKWIILDGDLDANWIESMNSVMDDNKILTLASNERIPLTSSMRMIFEIRDLKYATPATVSRAGILYITESPSQWQSFVKSWIARQEEFGDEMRALVQELFDRYVAPSLQFVRKNFKHIVPALDFNLVQSLCFLLEGMLTHQNFPPAQPLDKNSVEVYFVFAAVWAIGGPLASTETGDDKTKFNHWWKEQWTAVRLPAKSKTTVFDFYVDDKTRKFNPWSQLVPKLEFESQSMSMASFTVPTQETICNMHFLSLMMDRAHPVLLVGTAGSGKTQLVKEKLRRLPEEIVYQTINFNYYSDSLGLQAALEQPLEKKAGKNYGPPGTKKLVYFVDDLNMPQVDAYGTQSPIALLRQHIDYGHWYDRKKLSLKLVHNCQYVSCMNPAAGSFNINPRLQRHFFLLSVAFPGQDSLMTVFNTFLEGHLKAFDEHVQRIGPKIISSALDLHAKLASTFRKTAVNFHYEFNIRHLSNVFQGLLMSDGHHFGEPANEKVYNSIKSYEELNKTLEEALGDYNETNAVMNLVLFEDAMKHVCRISRIVSNPRGHALLVGVGGSGKQSLSRLAAHICGYHVFQIVISQTYGTAELREDLKSLYMKTGVKEESVLFLFTDSQITDERFLVYINDVLSSGEVADLWSAEEKENIMNAMRPKVKAAGKADTRENCMEAFYDRVRANLHVVLCFSPVGEGLRVRARRFPALVSCTSIDWFQPWPEEALLSVSRRFLAEVNLGASEAVRDAVVRFMPYSFQSVNEASLRYLERERRHNYTTPKSFLELIKLFKSMLEGKRSSLTGSIERLQTGLDKLQKTSSEVAVLEEELKNKMVEVEIKKAEAAEFAAKVKSEKEIVEEESNKAAVTAEECKVIAEEVRLKREECEVELQRAEPAVAAAEAALNTLQKKDLVELKSLKTPPAGIDDILAAVMVMQSPATGVIKDRSWQAAQKTMLSVERFMSDLKEFKTLIDKEQVPAANFKAVRQYTANPQFKGENVKTKSKAAAGLCDWVNNIVIYYDIICDVEPKRRALAASIVALEEAEKKKEEAEHRVVELNDKLSELIREFDAAEAAKDAVIAEAERCQRKLKLAQRLVAALASENTRWAQGVEELKGKLSVLVGDVLLSSAFVSYIGAFNNHFRQQLVDERWKPYLVQHKIPTSPVMDPLAILTTDAEIARWMNDGLPSDRVSIENGTILTSCARWPLMIDPQLQGIAWVKAKEAKNQLQVVRLGQKRMLLTLERALEDGLPVLIENIGETIDAVLAPVLGRNTIKKGRNLFVRLGDKEVGYHPNFRLILHTKLANPHYAPEIQAETTLINFTVTEDGLEDQLLARVVKKERPDLEEQKSELMQQQNDFKIKLKELEDNLLNKLNNAQGDILEDVALIENLEETKVVATEIGEKVKVAIATEAEINGARESYRPVASRASLLFFLMNELHKIHTFYHYSLGAFVSVFERAIDGAEQAADLPGRLASVTEAVTFAVFGYVRRGLFERHKLIVATQLCLRVQLKAGLLDPVEADFLVHGRRHPSPPHLSDKLAEFVTEQAWSAVCALRDLAVSAPAAPAAPAGGSGTPTPPASGPVPALQVPPPGAPGAPLSPNPSAAALPPTAAAAAAAAPKDAAPTTITPFAKLADDMEGPARVHWKRWCADPQAEKVDPPSDFAHLPPFRRLLLIRALRPDRVSAAISNYVRGALGDRYVDSEPFDAAALMPETAPSVPVFFTLFPGADPVRDIELLARAQGLTDANGKFRNVSMGQGQEAVAEAALDELARQGGWVFLQNIHLMQRWLPALERKLEACAEGAHADFRCFLSAEPLPDPKMVNIPAAILQGAVKVTNEPPQDLKANLRRALALFTPATMERCSRPQLYRPCFFALCFFHALVLGRRRFGFQGWSRSYSFNAGDLSICADVLYNYLEAGADVPWEDLRYMFGDIMYGGHITDKWDRRTCSTYLKVLLRPELFSGMALAPGFPSPPPSTLEEYRGLVEKALPPEAPALFGLHANAETEFLAAQGASLFGAILELQGAAGGAAGASKEEALGRAVEGLLARLPEALEPAQLPPADARGPYECVLVQEVERATVLVEEMRRSLVELRLGLAGALNISDAMEALSGSLFLDRVPAQWEKYAYPSLKPLGAWFADLLRRVDQLRKWGDRGGKPPGSVWLPGLFNPMSYLTAVVQVTARLSKQPLDRMAIATEVTKLAPERATEQPPDGEGAHVHGFFLEGAALDPDELTLRDPTPKELHPALPVVHVRAVPAEQWPPAKGSYECPVFLNAMRGFTYVFTAALKSNDPEHKWILAGVALLMADD
eukprot:tig00000828_g4612.t1